MCYTCRTEESMPWCPVCKEEYKEGITTCPECHATLVASLEEVEKSNYIDLLSFDNETLVKKFTDYLNYSKIPATYSKDTKTNSYIISVLKKDAAKAKNHFSAFYSVETSNALAISSSLSCLGSNLAERY